MAKKKIKQVPLTINSDGIASVGLPWGREGEVSVLHVENFTFKSKMKLELGHKGQNQLFEKSTGLYYDIGITNGQKIVDSAIIDKGYIESEWTFVKKGSNWLLTVAEKG